jgi:hypothetical protein
VQQACTPQDGVASGSLQKHDSMIGHDSGVRVMPTV